VKGRGWGRAALGAAAVFVAFGGFAGRGSAARGSGSGGRFVLDTRACPNVPEAAIRRIVGIEIGDLLIEPGREVGATAPPDRLIVRCEGDLAQVEAVAAGGSGRVARTLTLRDFPGDVAPRALALAGLEALAAQSRAVRARIQTRQAPPAAIAPARPPSAPAAASPDRTRLGLAMVHATFLASGGASVWGGRLELGREIGAMWDLGIDLELGGAQTSLANGEANAFLASLGAFGGLRAQGRHLIGVLAVGGRAGLTRLAGDPTGAPGLRGNDVVRPWAGPALTARLSATRGRFGATILAETGLAVRGADGLVGDQTVLAVNGGWVTLGAGLRF
jgi:hypothetical protein